MFGVLRFRTSEQAHGSLGEQWCFALLYPDSITSLRCLSCGLFLSTIKMKYQVLPQNKQVIRLQPDMAFSIYYEIIAW